MNGAPGGIEGGQPVVEAPKPAPAGPQKVEGPQAVQADTLADAAASAGAPDKQLGVLASGVKNVMNFFKGSALTEAQLKGIADTAPERAALAESLKKPTLEQTPMPEGLTPATGELAQEVAVKPTPAEVPTENPKKDGLPDAFDGTSKEGVTPSVTQVPAAGEASAVSPQPEGASAQAQPAETTTPPAENSPAITTEPAPGEKALTEINGLLGDGVVTKDSNAADLMSQLVAKGWQNDPETQKYVQGAIDAQKAKEPPAEAAQASSSTEPATDSGEKNTVVEQKDSEIAQLKETVEAMKDQIDQLVQINAKLAQNQQQEELMRQDQDEKTKLERRKRILKNLADIAKFAIMSAIVDISSEAGEGVMGQQQRR